MPEERLTIGELARRSRLSLKALRLYDELRLLPPHEVDPVTGYRYYRPDQAERARLIGLLRQLDMPLAEIAVVLERRDPAALLGWWSGVSREHERRAGVVRYLASVLDGSRPPAFEVASRRVAEVKVATLSRRVTQPELPAFIPEALATVRSVLAGAGVEADCIDWTVYHGLVSGDSDAMVEVCVPFRGSFEPSAGVAVRFEPEHDEAWTRVTKGQARPPDIMHAFDAVARWVAEHGRQHPDLDPREVYVADWVAVGDDEPAVDVAFPYRPLESR